MLDLPAAPDALVANAATGLFVTDLGGGLGIAEARATTGDGHVRVLDTVAAGDDVIIGPGGVMQALAGTVTIEAGDDVRVDASALVAAEHGVLIAGDVGDMDSGVGALIAIEGVVRGAHVTIRVGADRDTVALRRSAAGAPVTIDTFGGDDTIRLGSLASVFGPATGGRLDGFASTVTVNGGQGADRLEIDDSGSSVGGAWTLEADRLTGDGLGAAIVFTDIETVDIGSGSADDTLAVHSVASGVRATANMGAGDDVATVGEAGRLAGISGLVTIVGGPGTDRLVVDSSAETADTAGEIGGGSGELIRGFGMGAVDPTVVVADVGVAHDVETAELRLGSGSDTLTVASTRVDAVTAVHLGAGADSVVVGGDLSRIRGRLDVAGDGVSGADTITIASDVQASITLDVTNAPISMVGGAGADRLVLDVSAETAASTLGRLSTTALGAGVVTGLLGADADFSNVAHVEVRLGTGNDAVTVDVDDALVTGTSLEILGGGGDDLVLVERLGVVPLIVEGGAGVDEVRLMVPGAPISFAGLLPTVELLVVDNADNSGADSTPVDWRFDGAVLNTSVLSGPETLVVDVDGAGLTRILGGGHGSDTLSVRAPSDAPVTGIVDGDRIELVSGLTIVSQADPDNDYDRFRYYPDVIGFDGLANGAIVYEENGFRLETSNAGGLLVDEAVSRSVVERGAGDVLTLRAVDPDSAFSLYSLELASANGVGGTVSLTGLTITGGRLDATLVLGPGFGFSRLGAPTNFSLLSSVEIRLDGDVRMDNVVAVETLTGGDVDAIADVPTFTLSGAITLNTSGTPSISGGSVGLSDPTKPVRTTIEGGVAVFWFDGDLVVTDGTRIDVEGSRPVSIRVGNDARRTGRDRRRHVGRRRRRWDALHGRRRVEHDHRA